MSETLIGGKPAFTQCLPRVAESARAGRLLVDRALVHWGLGDLTDSAHLVVSELVTNAVEHGRRETMRVTVTRLDRTVVQVAVVDLSRLLPSIRRRPVADLAESGRGLFIVDALCPGRWGVEPLRWGKRVWADLDAAAEAPGE
ncbi:ATP-binding protein [Streptomyces sp. NBC_01233]|uniref:ATP-binding protein n=1 Tax=Streptomyces sp. NBC_01233 TaxID=2903787 RepID=UPI002E0E368D|nr:ATP-binding protein [Streptomyces sp. NBC_01233]